MTSETIFYLMHMYIDPIIITWASDDFDFHPLFPSHTPPFLLSFPFLSLTPSPSPLSLRATQGKGNEQFIQSLQDLLRVTCCMMAKDTPEGELVAPKAVSAL